MKIACYFHKWKDSHWYWHNPLNLLLYDRNFIGSSSEIFSALRKFSENARKRSSGLRTTFKESSEIFEKCSELFGKSWKTSSLVSLDNKQNITCLLVDTNFFFPCLTRYLTRSLRALVRYQVEHSKIKFVFTRGHVILYSITINKPEIQRFCLSRLELNAI